MCAAYILSLFMGPTWAFSKLFKKEVGSFSISTIISKDKRKEIDKYSGQFLCPVL